MLATPALSFPSRIQCSLLTVRCSVFGCQYSVFSTQCALQGLTGLGSQYQMLHVLCSVFRPQCLVSGFLSSRPRQASPVGLGTASPCSLPDPGLQVLVGMLGAAGSDAAREEEAWLRGCGPSLSQALSLVGPFTSSLGQDGLGEMRAC